MHADETPLERASQEVADWIGRLNAISNDFKSGSVTDVNWQGFLQRRFTEIPTDPPSRTKAGGIRFNGLTFIEITFRDFIFFQDPPLQNHEWRGCHFLNCDFAGSNWTKIDLRGTEFIECRGMTSLNSSNLSDCLLKNCNLRGSQLAKTQLVAITVIACDLRQVQLDDANLTNASFHAVEFDGQTSLHRLESTKNWHVDKYTIASLSDACGLTVGNRMDMVIRDDVAELQKQFSGLLRLLHLLSLTVFFAPYAWFLVSHWAEARFEGDTANTVPLYVALFRYFVNAGVDWQQGLKPSWGWLTVSILILLYNVVRFRLLWKTYDLEASQRISGVPVRFSLSESVTSPRWLSWLGDRPIWNWLYVANKFGYWFYLGFVALKAWHFLTMRIPLHV